MELTYFDSHCHPQLAAYDNDQSGVLERMEENGVGGLVVGVDKKTSDEAVELARNNDFLWAAVGLHPNDNPGEQFDKEFFRELAVKEKVRAIGECGLDYYRNEPTFDEKKRQHDRFLNQLVLAREVAKPLMIHCRPTKNTMNAHREMIEILTKNNDVRAVMHFFTGNTEVAEKYLSLGCYLSFPGVITFTNEYDEVVRMTPLDRLLSETDSPFAAPVPHRGKRNEPQFVIETVKKLAELKGNSVEELAVQIVKNSKNVFGMS
jgi:TatD DNase family protein